RLPVGMRDLYVSVDGDRTGAEFLAFVAPTGTKLVVSDVDGTLTEYENAYPESVALGTTVAPHPDAPSALQMVKSRGYAVVYVTARGDRFTQDTRDWFATNNFPRGPLRMPTAIITVPGEETVEFKRSALEALSAFEVEAGIGNRASDITAYMESGLPANRVFIKLPEFDGEIAQQIMAGVATGFQAYADLRDMHLASM
ncbi:MAG TPA: hypothetical protein VIV11_34925, partial [Kofleriaceae bacterium]